MMNKFSSLLLSALAISAGCTLLVSASAMAQSAAQPERQGMMGRGMMEHHGRMPSAEQRQAWMKQRLDREATLLEINASQQPAWDEYASARVDAAMAMGGMGMMGATGGPSGNADLNAAALARRHADRAADMARRLAKLADATEKLQAALSENQRRVLDRMARMHAGFSHFGRGHRGMMSGDRGRAGMRDGRGSRSAADAASKAPAKPAAKSPPALPAAKPATPAARQP